MTNDQRRKLCSELMHADSEEQVIAILKDASFWDDKHVWRLYGDRENNYSTIGNQQNKPDAALVEKIVNSVDARLMNECLIRGITPESSAAPQTIREAVANGVVFVRAMNVASALTSVPAARRPSEIASSSVVPPPQKGSKTRSPIWEKALMTSRAKCGEKRAG